MVSTRIKNILFLFAILVSSRVILAQGPGSNNKSPFNPEELPHPFHLGIFDNFPFGAPKFAWPQISAAGFLNSEFRHETSVGRSLIKCDYGTEGGFRCTGCNTVRRCYPFNIGTDSTCNAPFQYCNNGHCSRTRGSLCSDTTSTSPISPNSSSSSSSSSTLSSSTSRSSTSGSSTLSSTTEIATTL